MIKPLTQREIKRLNTTGKRAMITGSAMAIAQIKNLPFFKKLKFIFIK